jgi:hypothetical protein
MTPRSDAARRMPDSAAGRFDDAQAALASLREEERRLRRLGFREALSRCREQLRYWEFLAALFSLPALPDGRPRAMRRGH